MNAFDRAYAETLANEGGYSRAGNPADPGGETWRGVSRRHWPGWPGWAIVDAAKERPGFPRTLAADAELDRLTREFYAENFWQRLRCGELPEAVAVELFDSGVNVGTSSATWLLQGGLFAVGEPVAVDGRIGPATLAAATRRADDTLFQLVWRGVQIGFYLCLGLKVNENLRANFNGWLARARR